MRAVEIGQVWQSLRNKKRVRVEGISGFGYARVYPIGSSKWFWLTVGTQGILGYRFWSQES